MMNAEQLTEILRDCTWMGTGGKGFTVTIEDSAKMLFHVLYNDGCGTWENDYNGREWLVPIRHHDDRFYIQLSDGGETQLEPSSFWLFLFHTALGAVTDR